MPDPTLMTHLNYAFGKVTDTFDGMTIQNTDFLRKVMKLKEQNPELKIILSIGGWTAGNFSEMAADARCRMGFAQDCKKAVDEYGLDGIDIDCCKYFTVSNTKVNTPSDDGIVLKSSYVLIRSSDRHI